MEVAYIWSVDTTTSPCSKLWGKIKNFFKMFDDCIMMNKQGIFHSTREPQNMHLNPVRCNNLRNVITEIFGKPVFWSSPASLSICNMLSETPEDWIAAQRNFLFISGARPALVISRCKCISAYCQCRTKACLKIRPGLCPLIIRKSRGWQG